ncbi:MotE family protein [Devosia sp.]|uniref:MotE family protein n=1 Tax=Devosia sp. TaxID=1871048 RepID=UPI0035B26E14
MKTVRLLPIVIAASAALLLLKGIGLLTSGGYVLTGAETALAAGSSGGHGGGAADATGNPTIDLPLDHTMTDASPTLDDTADTLSLGGEEAGAGGHGASEAAAGGHGEEAAATDSAHSPDGGDAAADSVVIGNVVCPPEDGAPVEGEAPAAAGDFQGFSNLAPTPVDCVPDPGVTAEGDALPLIQNGSGQLVPLAEVSPNASSEKALLERLGERRDELDRLEKELEMRTALIEAAEKRLDERTAALSALEAKINALVDEKKSAEKQQFVALVAMYETMKPKEAALIFNQMDLGVLMQIARAMNPRKMAPIMAKMDPEKAKNLTSGLALEEVQQTSTADLTPEDLASLPQIVGQ